MQISPSHDGQIVDVDLVENFPRHDQVVAGQLICQP
jgi:hypothetical protein